MTDYDELKTHIETGRAAVVAGAGVAIATVNDGDLTWTSLIKQGIEHVVAIDRTKAGRWAEMVTETLEYGISNGDPISLVAAAEHVHSALNGRASGRFAAWLKSQFANLAAADDRVIVAISQFRLPVLTTNYDDLIERVLERRAITWMESRELQEVVAGREDMVAHLHGVWNRPETVIFGAQSYGTLLNQPPAQALQNAVGMTRSLIFIGCGDGTGDPNVGGLLGNLEALVPDSAIKHYFLHRTGDAPQRLPEHVKAIPYGDSFEDLPTFLETLAPKSQVMTISGAEAVHHEMTGRAALHIIEQVRAEVLLGELFDDIETAALSDLLTPPVLLPVTHQAYANSRQLSSEQRIPRCDIAEEIVLGRRVLLAAEEHSGLSTTLRWMVHEVHKLDPLIAPVYVDFRTLSTGKAPLRKRIVQSLRQAGYYIPDGAPLPRIALALDNVVQDRVRRTLDKVLDELDSPNIEYLVIGTRQGAEHELTTLMSDRLDGIVQRYVGRMNTADIRALAQLAAPSHANELTGRAVEILRQEHLPRTPYTVCMLLLALLRGQVLSAVNSETALLDAYITLVLGATDPLQNARVALDYFDRRKLLGVLAGDLVRRDTASLPHEDVARLFKDFFDAVDWDEDSLDVLNDLVLRRVLKNGNGVVSFAHASYLHLFAASHARDDLELRSHIFNRALYYSDIVRHYVALSRDDADALRKVADILASASVSVRPSVSGHSFGNTPVPNRELDASTAEELLASLELGDIVSREHEESDTESASDDPLDRIGENDLDPFPADRIEDAPPMYQIMTAVSLVSNVLRDSESVTDLKLKRDVLARTLSVWGMLVTLFEGDVAFQEFIEKVSREFADEIGLSEERAKKFTTGMKRIMPVLAGVSGMSSTLASRKLARTLDRLFADQDIADDPGASIMGAILSLAIGPGWGLHFLNVSKSHPRRRALDFVMLPMATAAYYLHDLDAADIGNVEEFVALRKLTQVKVDNATQAKDFANQVKEKLRKERALYSKRRLSQGETILQQIDAGEEADLDVQS